MSLSRLFLSSRGCAALLALGVALAGCSFDMETSGLVENRCAVDADCPGATCDVKRGMCVSGSPAALRVSLELIPGGYTDSTLTNWRTAAFDVTEALVRDARLPATVEVRGTVVRAGASPAIPATVTFTRRGLPPGAQDRIAATTLPETATDAGGRPLDFHFSVWLAAGHTYDVLVEPDSTMSSTLPPLRTSITLDPVPDDAQVPFPSIPLDIVYPESLETVTMTVLMVDELGEPTALVDGLQVHAIESATGRVVSSLGAVVVDREGFGSFSIHLSPGARDYTLRFLGPTGSTTLPSLTVTPTLVADGLVQLPRPASVRYEGLVEQLGSDGQRTVGEAVLTFRSEEIVDEATGVAMVFRTSVQTTADGRFEVVLAEGAYEVVVRPATGSEAGILSERVVISRPTSGDAVRGQLFTLPPRARIEGFLTALGMKPVSGATVQALALGRAIDAAEISRAAPHNRSTDTVTNAEGRFTIGLDVGAYDLLIKSPSESGFGWTVRPDLVVGATDRTLTQDFVLEAPIPLQGRVRTHDRTPIPGAEVKAYAWIGEGDAVRLVPIGSSTTDREGRYQIFLPPRISSN